jgi:heme-degrading monooxygenase HmoA
MVYEHATLTIEPGRDADFEAAVGRAPEVFRRAKGFRSMELRRCIEEPSRYVLLVGWDTLEDHTVGFRESDLFGEWRALVSEFFAGPPAVEHYEVVASG